MALTKRGTRHIRHVYHSPTGMEWGYGGKRDHLTWLGVSSPDFAGIKVADTFYQDFKRDFVQNNQKRDFKSRDKKFWSS